MKKTIKKKWLAALRDGSYKQGRLRLRSSDGFCCLGVLCDLHAKDTEGLWTQEENKPANSRYLDEITFLPTAVVKWAGLKDNVIGRLGTSNDVLIDAAMFPKPLGYPSLSGANDSNYSFAEIADIIEAQL